MTNAIATRRTVLPARKPTVALALGGGGARGLAHIAMLEVLDELGVRPKVMAGTSIGALFGVAYAAGLSAAQIRAMTEETLSGRYDMFRQLFAARSNPVQKVLNLLPLRSALLNAEAVVDMVLPSRMPTTFKGLQIPLRVVATDLGRRATHVFTEGELKPAVAASIAIPVLFSPVVINRRTFVDGGLVNPLPYDLVAGEADITIAIDVSGGATEADVGPSPSVLEAMMSSIGILERSITREKLKVVKPDIYIDVDVDQFHILEFYKPADILKAAEPAKRALKLQLARMLASETIEAANTIAAEEEGKPASRRRRPRLFSRKGAAGEGE
jgi:NTE family protein